MVTTGAVASEARAAGAGECSGGGSGGATGAAGQEHLPRSPVASESTGHRNFPRGLLTLFLTLIGERLDLKGGKFGWEQNQSYSLIMWLFYSQFNGKHSIS